MPEIANPTSVQDCTNVPAKEVNTLTLMNATSSDSVELIGMRMEQWRELVKQLLDYFEEIASVESSTSKGLEKSVKYLSKKGTDPLMIDEEQLGIMHLISAVREHSTLLASHHHESSQALNAETIFELKALRDEIKDKEKTVKKEYSNLNSKLTKTYDASINDNKEVTRAIEEFHLANTDPDKDPWLINREMHSKRHAGVNQENNIARSIEMSMSSLSNFESGLVQRIKSVLDKYYTRKEQTGLSSSQQATHLRKLVGSLSDDAEWTSFQAKHPDILPMHAPEPRSADDIKYPEAPVLEAAKEGHLCRRSGVGPFKSWKSYFVVVTASGFLHAFQSSDQHVHPSPDFSIPLTRARIEPSASSDKESPYTFEVMDYSAGGVFSSEKTYVMRAESQKELDEWLGALLVWSDKISPTSTTSSKTTHAVIDPLNPCPLTITSEVAPAPREAPIADGTHSQPPDLVKPSTVPNPEPHSNVAAPSNNPHVTKVDVDSLPAGPYDNPRS